MILFFLWSSLSIWPYFVTVAMEKITAPNGFVVVIIFYKTEKSTCVTNVLCRRGGRNEKTKKLRRNWIIIFFHCSIGVVFSPSAFFPLFWGNFFRYDFVSRSRKNNLISKIFQNSWKKCLRVFLLTLFVLFCFFFFLNCISDIYGIYTMSRRIHETVFVIAIKWVCWWFSI